MKFFKKSNLRWLAVMVMFILASCQDDLLDDVNQTVDENLLNTEQIINNGETNAREGSGTTISFRSGSSGFDVDDHFIDVENVVTGTSGDDYVWECCLGIGHFGEQGQLLYLQRGNGWKPALFSARENMAGDSLIFYGITAFWQATDGWYDMPFDENVTALPVLLDGVFIDNLTIDIGGWGTTELNFRIPGVTPAGYPEEYCVRILMPFGHNENGVVVTCIKNGIEQFIFEGKHKVFRLTTDDGGGTIAEFLVIQGLHNGMPAMFAAEDYPAYNIVAGDPILRASMPGAGTEIARILVEYLHDGVWEAKYAFPTLIADDIHGTDGIGCPVSLKEIPSLECPIDCDSTAVDCAILTEDCDKASNREILDDTPDNQFLDAFDDLMRKKTTDRMVVVENSGISVDGSSTNMLLRMPENAGKFGEGVFTLKRNGNNGNRAIIEVESPGNASIKLLFEDGTALAVGDGPYPYTVYTPNGVFTWNLDRDDFSNDGELFLQRLEDKKVPVSLNGTQIGEVTIPHETLNLITASGGNIYVNGVDATDGKVIKVIEDDCYYLIEGTSAIDGRMLVITQDVSKIGLFDGSCKIESRVGMPVTNIEAPNGKHYYIPVNSEDL